MAELASYVIYRGRDPFTKPQTTTEWVKTSIPGFKTPVMKFKFMNSEIKFVIEGPDAQDVKTAFERCIQGAAIKSLLAGVIAGYASGGSAAASAASITFTIELDRCVEEALKRAVDITSSFQNSSHWDDDYS